MANNVTYKVLVQKLGGTQVTNFIGQPGDLFYDPGAGSIRLSDGATPGGANTTISNGNSDDEARTVANAAFEKANSTVQDAFVTIEVSGQNNIVAASNSDTLVITPGTGTSITTDPGNNTITVTSTALDGFARAHSNSSFDLANLRAQNAFSSIGIQDKGSLLAESNADVVVLSPGSGIDVSGSDNTITISSSINSFSTISVSGQNNIVSDANADTLTLVAGDGISITTNQSTDVVTVAVANTTDQYARAHSNAALILSNNQPVAVFSSAIPVVASNTTGFQTMATVTVPGGSMGPNGWVQCFATWTMGGTVNNKIISIRALGPASQIINSITATNHISFHQSGIIYNRGNTQQQISSLAVQNFYGGSTSANVNTNHAINTDSDWVVYFSCSKVVEPTDIITLEQHRVVVQYRA